MHLFEVYNNTIYQSQDLILLHEQCKNGRWYDPVPVNEFLFSLLENKKSKIQPQTQQNKPMLIQKSELFEKTFDRKKQEYPLIAQKMAEFIAVKQSNPIMQYGSSDKAFSGEGVFTAAVPKLKHAHLTHDVSVFYTISGSDPIVLKLYGVFRHDESGTGSPANIKLQKSVSKTLANQTFR